MQEKKQGYYTLAEVVDVVRSFVSYMRKKWLLLLVAVVAGAGLGFGYSLIQKPKYQAVTTFLLEEKSGGGGSLAGLASQFGFDLGSAAGGNSIFAGDNILDILRSKVIVHKVLLSKVDPAKGAASPTLADLFIDFNNWKKNWPANDLTSIDFTKVGESGDLLPRQDSVLNIVHQYLLKKSIAVDRLNKKGSIIWVQVSSQNPLFARLLTGRLVEEASKMYLSLKTGMAQAGINRLQRRADSLLVLLNTKSYSAAASQILDANPGVKTSAVPVEIAMRDKTVISTLYIEITKNLEASKLLLAQQTPAIQVLDGPEELLSDKRKGLFILLIVGGFVVGVLAAGWLLIKFVITLSRNSA
jgi:hypothetical protein